MHEALNVAQVCRLYHIPEATIRRLVKFDEIPHRKRGDDPVFFRDELDAWASRRLLALQERPLAEEHTLGTRAQTAKPQDDILIPALLSPDRITLDLAARTRHGVLRDMVDLAAATDCLYDPPDLLRQLEEREAICSTAMPGGIALLHPHHQDPYLIGAPFMVIGAARQPVHFGAPDNAPTDLFCLVCCGEARRHIHTLSRLAMMIRNTSLLGAARSAGSTQAVFEAFCAAELAVLKNIR